MALQIAVLRERIDGERRVALTPDIAGKLVAAGHEVRIERGAGDAAGWSDAAYTEAGARIAATSSECVGGAAVVLAIHPPGADERAHMARGQALICMLNPLGDQAGVMQLAEAGIHAYAMELIPRTSRAQAMDALSSMATVAGYRAVLMAAERLDKFFPMLMTAAGTVAPAKVFVVGAGVAGLQAIATARRLGAVVTAYDTRSVVREQVESVGGRFVQFDVVGEDAESRGGYARELTAEEQERQRELMAEHIIGCDVVITTALVPGRPAPRIIPTSVVERMRSGSVIVDLASENGGNCESSVHGAEVNVGGVRVIGPDNLPGGMPVHASQLYARNITNLLELMVVHDAFEPDMSDDIIAGTCATAGGEVVHPLLRDRYGLAPAVTSSGQEVS
jgi:NAD(P) transhydrogenase subunit alpha